MNKGTILVTTALLVMLIGIAFVSAWPNSGKDGVTMNILKKHLHMGGQNHVCSDCHSSEGVADPPGPLKGRYANMGGPNHECGDCHNGIKAPELPLPEGYTSCAGEGGCHPTE